MHTEQRRSDGTSIITLSAIRHRKLDRSPDTRCCVVHRPGIGPHKLHVPRPSYSTVFTPDQFFEGDQIQLLQHQKLTCALYLNKNQVTLAAHFQMTA
ncbi:uncharacterized protein UBRO_20909 [Ustilago bromivora]|uniref:Uncharacterized protein n=1 Tax=Ustilago bromivora TaxID=307758 RepID=A0A1K0GBK9_9BASI|nr:uncharacterized protein UBRO_20909 [Ustilago bromivora]